MTKQSVTLNPTVQARIAVMSRGDEDRAQEMYLSLLERERKDRRFAKQQVGYHIKAAKWAGKDRIRANAIYDRYVECETFVLDDDGEEVSVFDTLISDDDPGVEALIERNEQARELRRAILMLPDNQRKIAGMLLNGYAPFEIAKRLGTSKSNVSHIMAKMCATLAQLI